MKTMRILLSQWWIVVGLVALWELWVRATGLGVVVMPSPSAIAVAVWDQPGIFLTAAMHTAVTAGTGLALGMTVGCLLAVLCFSSVLLSGLLTPVALVFVSVPVVGIVPILARLFGYGAGTAIAIVVIISFFPAYVLTSAGLRALPAGSADLFRVLGARALNKVVLLAAPAAIPSVSVALRISAGHSILAAMVAEFLMGVDGLGHLFDTARTTLDMALALGASLLAALLSTLLFGLTLMIERRVNARWR